MNIYYYNFAAAPVNDGLPEVLRARCHCLAGVREKNFYRVTLSSFLVTAGFSSCSEEWRFGEEKKWRRNKAGFLTIYPPGTVLEIQSIPGVERHGMMLYFQGGESVGLHTLFASGEKYVTLADSDGSIRNLLKEIAMLPAENSFWLARIKLLQILALVRLKQERSQISDKTFADNVDNFLRRSLNQPLKREDIARELNISVSLLSHRYMQERGLSVMRRHLEMRLEQAKLHLLNGETIQRTAEVLGFCSPFHLSRAFKEHFGVSPAKYTKHLRQDQPFEHL